MVKRKHIGHLPPEYNFSLNPYPQFRFSKCPDCQNKTGQRKLPLSIHIDPGHLVALNYPNRYCTHCNMLIGHKHEIEHHLTQKFLEIDPNTIGNNYLVFGTVEKKAWRENLKQQIRFDVLLHHTHDFLSYQVIRMSMGGWFAEGQVPPIMEPPPSTEWLKS
ncbi:MAG: hypothetical protein ACOC23_06315 [Thermodesulfobacteriota bacterium]